MNLKGAILPTFCLCYFTFVSVYLAVWVSDFPRILEKTSTPELTFLKQYFQSINTPGPLALQVPSPIGTLINFALFAIFAFHHSYFLRPHIIEIINALHDRFDWLGLSNAALIYPLMATNLLHVLIVLWQPDPHQVWDLKDWLLGDLFMTLHFVASLIFFALCLWPGVGPSQGQVKNTGLYAYCRHPMYACLLLMFWCSSFMTSGHLLFSVLATFYILLGSNYEEAKLVKLYGDEYIKYQQQAYWFPPVIDEEAKPTPAFCVICSLMFMFWWNPEGFIRIVSVGLSKVFDFFSG